jgi:ferredoxin
MIRSCPATAAGAGNVPPELADQVRHAVQSCPKTALRLTG